MDFSYSMLVDNGRLAMWMPTANDDDIELSIPSHPGLKLVSISVQQFNKCMHHKWEELRNILMKNPGARRLLTYRRLPDNEVQVDVTALKRERAVGRTASDLNSFRKKVGHSHLLIVTALTDFRSTLTDFEHQKKRRQQQQRQHHNFSSNRRPSTSFSPINCSSFSNSLRMAAAIFTPSSSSSSSR